MVWELLQHPDIDTTLQTQMGDTAMDMARRCGCDAIVALLEQHARGEM